MRKSRPQLLDVLFDNAFTTDKSSVHGSQLCNVQEHATALLKLNRAVKELLPSQLQPWCRVANYRQSILMLETANASWMMRLRYEQPALLSALRAQILPSLSSIDIRINPALMARGHNIVHDAATSPPKIDESAPLRYLSFESAKELEVLADRSPERLRVIFERLAALAGENTNTTKNDH